MWEQYAPNPRMKINMGIRRRLAPLVSFGGKLKFIEYYYTNYYFLQVNSFWQEIDIFFYRWTMIEEKLNLHILCYLHYLGHPFYITVTKYVWVIIFGLMIVMVFVLQCNGIVANHMLVIIGNGYS